MGLLPFIFLLLHSTGKVKGSNLIFTQSWVKLSLFPNLDLSTALYIPSTTIKPGLEVAYSLWSKNAAFSELLSVDPRSGQVAVHSNNLRKFSQDQKGVEKISYELCAEIQLNKTPKGSGKYCQELSVKLVPTALSCELSTINKVDLKEALIFGSYDFSSCLGCSSCQEGASCSDCQLSAASCSGCQLRLGQLFSPVLASICPDINTQCKINNDAFGFDTDDFLVWKKSGKNTNNVNNFNNNNFTVDCTLTKVGSPESLKIRKTGRLQITDYTMDMPRTQAPEHLSFYPKQFYDDSGRFILSMYTDATKHSQPFRFEVGCNFISVFEPITTYTVHCGQEQYKQLAMCKGNPGSMPTMMAISLSANKSTLEDLLRESEFTNCSLKISDSSKHVSSCQHQVEYNLTFHRADKPDRVPVTSLSNTLIQAPEDQEFVVQRSWRKFSRVGNIPSKGFVPENCSYDNISATSGVGIVENIFFVKNDISELPEISQICLRNLNTKDTIQIKLQVEDEEVGCTSADWCSVHPTEQLCTSSCHSLTGEHCQWIQSMEQGYGFTYSTCVSNRFCGDGHCDQLERKHEAICKQDCAEFEDGFQLLGTGNAGPHRGIAGVKSANSTCICSHHNCQCAHNRFSDITPLSPKPSRKLDTGVCGEVCKMALSLSGSGVVFVSMMIIVFEYIRRRRQSPSSKYIESMSSMPLSDYAEDSRSTTSTLATNTTNSSIFPTPAHYMIDRKYEFPRTNLILEETLGEGEFGKVMSARALNFRGQSGYTRVAIKMLKPLHSSSELQDLVGEYELLKEVDHPNVIKLLGACTDRRGPLYIIIEYAKHGSLRSFLRECRGYTQEKELRTNSVETSGTTNSSGLSLQSQFSLTSDDSVLNITTTDLINFAWQVSKGMAYLAEIKLVHRDLAARNVLVAEGKICKVSDFGLTRDIYTDAAYWKKTSGKLPIKWMAPESLRDQIYTSKSDVWGFGVLLWELVTLGSSPYPGVQPDRLFPLLSAGYRMQRPNNCSPQLYNMMLDCWIQSPEKRPSFNQLEARLEKLLQSSACYLDLEPETVHNSCYMDSNSTLMSGSFEHDPEGYLQPKVSNLQPSALVSNLQSLGSSSYLTMQPSSIQIKRDSYKAASAAQCCEHETFSDEEEPSSEHTLLSSSEHTIYSKDINNTSPYRNNSEQSKHSSCTNVHKTENSGEETPGLYNYASLCPLHVEQALKQNPGELVQIQTYSGKKPRSEDLKYSQLQYNQI